MVIFPSFEARMVAGSAFSAEAIRPSPSLKQIMDSRTSASSYAFRTSSLVTMRSVPIGPRALAAPYPFSTLIWASPESW